MYLSVFPVMCLNISAIDFNKRFTKELETVIDVIMLTGGKNYMQNTVEVPC